MARKIPKYYDYELIGRTRLDATLALANSDPLLIRRGLVTGGSLVHKFGRDPAAANGTWGGVLQAGAQFPWLTAATTVRVKAGGNAADDSTSSPLGAGAREVTVQGMTIAGIDAIEAIATAGASASASTTTEFFRVDRAWVSEPGVYGGNNTDDIVIEATGGTDLIMIAAGEGQTQFAGYTIRAGKVAYLASALVQADGLKPADFRLMTRANANSVTPPFTATRLKYFWDGVLGFGPHNPFTPSLELPAWTDIWIEARGSGAITEVSASFELIIYGD
jgi:hypothetical protein